MLQKKLLLKWTVTGLVTHGCFALEAETRL